MADQNRKAELCDQAPAVLTGIDFVQIEDHEVQTRLLVYFVVDPDSLTPPIISGPFPTIVTDFSDLEIISTTGGQEVEIIGSEWIIVATQSGNRTVLAIDVDRPGDFSLYRLRYEHAQIDRFFSEFIFSFKQACPSGLDCKLDHICPPNTVRDVNIDYLARDFNSLRGALMDFAAQYYPEWEARIEADQATMLLEIMAALGDEFAYTQDRYALEAYLDTATQTRSVVSLARLVDYQIDRGQSATTLLAIGVDNGQERYTSPRDPLSADPPDRAYALREDAGKISFEITKAVWVHPRWNEADLHMPDPARPCLPRGATEAYLILRPPSAGELPDDISIMPARNFWIGRRIILRSGVGAPDEPDRAWAVTITELEPYTDPLCLDEDDNPIVTTYIRWADHEALPFEMPLAFTKAYLNCVPAIAGETVIERFRTGTDQDIHDRYTSLSFRDRERILGLPRAIERQGACVSGGRGRMLRYGLTQSPEKGVAWHPGDENKAAIPAALLIEIELDTLLPVPDFTPLGGEFIWDFTESVLSGDAEDRVFTLEDGLWREIVRFRKPGGDVVHYDYAGNDGFTVRFSDGGFGRTPSPGSLFQIAYLSAPGIDANLPVDTITHRVEPGSNPELNTLDYAIWVTNPFSVNSARAQESVDSVRINAPEAYQALPLRAVRNEDYREILEREASIQQANAISRWTGSWATDFISIDPVGTTRLSPELRYDTENTLDCIRQAGRSVCLKDPEFLPFDLEIHVCADPKSSNAQVIKRVTAALTGPANDEAFFHPDNFTFGQPLIRSKLEAAIQCVPSVRAVELIKVRRRGQTDFVALSGNIQIAPHQIIQIANDPARPETGYVEVHAEGGG